MATLFQEVLATITTVPHLIILVQVVGLSLEQHVIHHMMQPVILIIIVLLEVH